MQELKGRENKEHKTVVTKDLTWRGVEEKEVSKCKHEHRMLGSVRKV